MVKDIKQSEITIDLYREKSKTKMVFTQTGVPENSIRRKAKISNFFTIWDSPEGGGFPQS